MGASRASEPIERVELGEGEEVEVVLEVRDAVDDERAEEVHPALALAQRRRGLLPGATERVGLVVGQQPAPGVEDLLDLRGVPLLVPGHQADVEVVAVDPHVEDVEGAHRRPAVLVGERERGDVVPLHLLHQGGELVERRGRGVAVLLPDRLPVEDRPRVVADRHEVLLAVGGGGGLEGVVHAVDGPHVGDVGDQPVVGELLHPVAREPGEDVVGAALEVGVDVLLERVVVDRVQLDLGPGRLGVGVGHALEPVVGGTGARGLVDAELHRAAASAARAAAAVVTSARCEQGRGRREPRLRGGCP